MLYVVVAREVRSTGAMSNVRRGKPDVIQDSAIPVVVRLVKRKAVTNKYNVKRGKSFNR